jgi:flotillin
MSLEADGRAAALRAQAGAEADAAKLRGAADAEAARLRGIAEADVIRAKGEAEAEAMRVKAAAYHEYNQAAVLDKVISNLPEMVRAIAEPLSKVDKISILSTGGANGGNLGASRVTGDVVTMLAQVPAILEALTGVRMSDLMAQVPGLRTVESTTGDGSPDGAQPANGAKEPPQVPVVQRVKVPAPDAPEANKTTATDTPATPSNNSTAGPSAGATAGPRKQPMR